MKRLAWLAIFLALTVVLLGAYTRLKDAGLGCPDWPGCYGQWTVPHHPAHIAEASERFPNQPLMKEKAWAEMVHRYFASALGLLIVGMTLHVHRYPQRFSRSQRYVIALLLFTVILQGLLGKFTVTLGLHPIIVLAHLLGGFLTLTLLGVFAAILKPRSTFATPSRPRSLISLLCILVLVAQIALGGWTSANYAARSCPQLPVCTDDWIEVMDFSRAFAVPDFASYAQGAGTSYEHAPHLDVASKMTIQMTHRIGALITTLVIGLFCLSQLRPRVCSRAIRRQAAITLMLLAAQVTLGILNVLLDLPLNIAVAHNGVAVLLLLSLVILTQHNHPQPTEARHDTSNPSARHQLRNSLA